jgi:hypothetical protein
MSIYLIRFGIKQHWLLRYDDGSFPPGWLFYVIPWAIAAIMILGLLSIILAQAGRSVLVAATYIECRKGSQMTRIPFQRLSFTAPQRGRFRSALISDGTGFFFPIEEIFWPEFDLLVSIIQVGCKRSREDLRA